MTSDGKNLTVGLSALSQFTSISPMLLHATSDQWNDGPTSHYLVSRAAEILRYLELCSAMRVLEPSHPI